MIRDSPVPCQRLERMIDNKLYSFYYIYQQHAYSADALANASCNLGGNLYLSCDVYVVRSSTICLIWSIIFLRVPSLPEVYDAARFSLWRVQHMMVHMMRLGTLIATG